MKKLYLLSLIIISISFAAPAQVYYYNQSPVKPEYDIPDNEISLGIGLSPLASLIYSSDGNVSFNLSYSRNLNTRLTVGILMSYTHVNDRNYYSYDYEYDDIYNIFSPMLTLRANWYYTDNFRIYSHFAMGVWFAFFNENYNSSNHHYSGSEMGHFPSFQISPLGIEWGNRFVVYAEAGIGFSGYFNFGIRTRF